MESSGIKTLPEARIGVTAFALANDLGIQPLFINASSQNSIDVIRTDVVNYATTVSLYGTNHKIIIFDECDRLSPAAQDSLKGIIEEVSKNCRFIFTCNSKSKIIEPLLSRCEQIDFIFDAEDRMSISAEMYKRSIQILENEGIEYKKDVIANLVSKFSPDNRKIILKLQHFSRKYGQINEGVLAEIVSADVSTLVKNIKEKDFKGVLEWCVNNEDAISQDFYQALYKALKDELLPQSVPELILILGQEQKFHRDVPDMFLHMSQMCVQIMMQVKFKGA